MVVLRVPPCRNGPDNHGDSDTGYKIRVLHHSVDRLRRHPGRALTTRSTIYVAVLCPLD